MIHFELSPEQNIEAVECWDGTLTSHEGETLGTVNLAVNPYADHALILRMAVRADDNKAYPCIEGLFRGVFAKWGKVEYAHQWQPGDYDAPAAFIIVGVEEQNGEFNVWLETHEGVVIPTGRHHLSYDQIFRLHNEPAKYREIIGFEWSHERSDRTI